MQVIVIEEIVDAVQVELRLGPTHLGPLDLEILWYVPGLNFTQAQRYPQTLGFRAPDRAHYHSLLTIILPVGRTCRIRY